MDLDTFDIEHLVSYEGYEYKVSNGNSGVQINVKTCPNCRREDYKVYLNADNGLGNCFGCNVGFNKYKFVKLSRGLSSHGEVMRYFDSISSYTTYKPRVVVETTTLNEDWKLPLNIRLENPEDIPSYLVDRKVDAKLCKRFDLRLCKYGFYKYQDFSDKTKFVDFSQRVIIPIHNIEGELVTFQGRDIQGTSDKKYLFPNMLPGTARYIYNAHYAKKVRAKKAILGEGVFDVFATTRALESDIKYKDFAACGTFGKNLSISAYNTRQSDQLTDLSALRESGVDEFILLWDGEPKAIEAAIEAGLNLIGLGFNATVARLSGGLDPDESSIEQILSAIDNRIVPSKLELVKARLLK